MTLVKLADIRIAKLNKRITNDEISTKINNGNNKKAQQVQRK